MHSVLSRFELQGNVFRQVSKRNAVLPLMHSKKEKQMHANKVLEHYCITHSAEIINLDRAPRKPQPQQPTRLHSFSAKWPLFCRERRAKVPKISLRGEQARVRTGCSTSLKREERSEELLRASSAFITRAGWVFR